MQTLNPTGDITEDVSAEVVREEEAAAAAMPYASPTTPPPAKSMGRRALGGAAWTFAGFGAQQVVRFISVAILWNWLAPAVFGLVNAVYTIRDALVNFSDIGLGQSLIQSKRTDKAFQHTAWTLSVIRGAAIFLVVALSAPLIAHVYLHEPQHWWVVTVIAAVALLDGFSSTSIYTHPRRLKVAGVSVLEFVSQFISTAVIIVLAYKNRSVVPLLVGGIVLSLVRTVGSHLINRDTPDGFALERKASHEMIVFGRWIVVSSTISFLAANSDKFVLQGMLVKDLAKFGVYGTALNIAMIPLQTLLKVGIRVVFPAFSATINAGGDLRRAFGKARRFVATGAGFSATCFFAAGPAIVGFLSPKAYEMAGVYLSILAISIWLQTLDAANQALLYATGKNKWSAYSSIVKFVLLLILMPVGYKLGDMPGALIGIVAADVGKYLVSSIANLRLGMPLVRTDLLSTLWFGAFAVAMRLFIHHNAGAHKLQNFIEMCFVGVVSAAASGALFLWFAKQSRQNPSVSNRKSQI